MGLGTLYDLDLPGAGAGNGRGHFPPPIAGIGEDALNEGERRARPAQQLIGAVAILHIGRVDRHVQQQTERVDEDVPLAACDLLTRIEALRVDQRPPFCAALALWLSMIAADGLASRPSRSRVAT